jgi:hypothetical protein
MRVGSRWAGKERRRDWRRSSVILRIRLEGGVRLLRRSIAVLPQTRLNDRGRRIVS